MSRQGARIGRRCISVVGVPLCRNAEDAPIATHEPEISMSSLRPLLTRPVPLLADWLGWIPPAVPSILTSQLSRIPPVRSAVSRLGINFFAYATEPRPRPLTLAADYTSWKSLTDRTFTGRHLPPADEEFIAALPSEADVTGLFRRDQTVMSTDTSVMFMFFAQWFTDSFLRTSHTDYRKNTSNHEIDLCQVYGLSEVQTNLLRAHEGGRLKSQVLNGEEYPPFLFERRKPGERPRFKAEFVGLHDEAFIVDVILGDAPDERKDSVFAVGLEHGNSTIGNTIMNVVFLREHNRVARLLSAEHADWDDDRLFETARNILIVLLLRLVVEEYIKHIGPFDFPVEAVPFIADGERWNRANWIAIEFNLLYRWHSLVPDAIGEGPDRLDPSAMRNNNPLVIAEGVEALISRCSTERAGRIGLANTPRFLVDRSQPDHPSVEERTVALMRKGRLRSFNDYREAFGLRRLSHFGQLTDDERLRGRLEALYGDIDRLEWYVGIFAEDYPAYMMMGELMTTMVACDAFTQAMTNPLLARNIFNAGTFTPTGLDIIDATTSLEQIVMRNSRSPEDVYCSFRS
jgi:prostaglandin-endoperoxide synthase 2